MHTPAPFPRRRELSPGPLLCAGGLLGVVSAVAALLIAGGAPDAAVAASAAARPTALPALAFGQAFPCDEAGWTPDGYGIKDHAVFAHGGSYYLAATYLGLDDYENRFAYASSPDLCQWTELSPLLGERPPGGWDEYRIWAPFVYVEGGVYYMYYTGVTHAFAQSIMLATSTNPADPGSWSGQGVVFQPSHEGSLWQGFDAWSDCRDPTVAKVGDLYTLFYTGLDVDGGIVGLATAPSPLGPWQDLGAVVVTPGAMPESPALAVRDGIYYLFYHSVGPSGVGPVFRFGPWPGGPWSAAYAFHPGWAHEVWTGLDAGWYTSYLTIYAVTIRPLTWDAFYTPPHPFIGDSVYHTLLPLVQR